MYLDIWYLPIENMGSDEGIPLCILYHTVSDSSKEIIYVTKPWRNDLLVTISIVDFLKHQGQGSLKGEEEAFFTDEVYAKGFRLLEDREAWSLDESKPPS